MEYAISVFILGLMVTALVAKGVFLAQDFEKEELKRQEDNRPGKVPN